MFKVLTGYGSTTRQSNSKSAVIKSLSRMKREGIIEGFLPGEMKHQLLSESSSYYETKLAFEHIIKKDCDFGNEGIVFVFVK